MKERRKVDFSNTPAVTSSLGDKLRGLGLSTPATADDAASDTPVRAAASPAPTEPAPPSGPLSGCGRVVARMERKGHGGKIATVVDGLTPLDARLRDALARRLAKALGAGARVQGLTIVVQGDQRTRIEALLRAEGARRVVVA